MDEAGCQADFEIDDQSDTECLYESEPGHKINTSDCGIQTSHTHFNKITSTESFKRQQAEKEFSTDWQYSSIYNELEFKKKPAAV